MSCFYYEKREDCFKPHKEEYKPCIEENKNKAPVKFKHPFSLILAVRADKLFSECLWNVFPLSSHFSGRIRVLNLRGYTQLKSEFLQSILRACTELTHLDLSYCKLVDDACVSLIGLLFKTKLLSLVLRSCHSVTDEGFIEMCENFSGAKAHRIMYPSPANDDQRYKELNKVDLTSYLTYLNIGDVKNLSNRSMKSISVNLMSSLIDLCIWGNYKITNDGILDLCMSHPEAKLRRINHCGCYKVTDDSRLWFMNSFKTCVINYIRVEDFGPEIDYDAYIDQETFLVVSSNDI